MKTRIPQQPVRITGADIETLAREGVARALAAREAMCELDPALAAAVNGGVAFASLGRTAGMWTPIKLAAIPPSTA